jgi:hypothetical protein
MIRQTIPYVVWIAGFLAAGWILTFPGAVVVFLTVFLTRQGGVRLRSALLAGVIVMVVLMTVVNLMDMVLPASIWAQL